MDYFDYMAMDDFDNEYPFEEQLYYEEFIIGQRKLPAGESNPTSNTKMIA